MSTIPDDLLYTRQHEWIRVDGDVGTVGITDYAQQQLGDLTYVEPPPLGVEVAQGAEACALESCKAAASIYAPAGGTVAEVNGALEDDPGLINNDCYGQGWIFKIRLQDTRELSKLMTPQQYGEMPKE